MYHISKDKRSRETSTMISDALERLMKEAAYPTITITDLCRKAGIGRVSFYRHFDSMDDVLQKRCDDKFEGLVTYFQEFYRTNGKKDPFIRPFLQYWYIHSDFLALLLRADKEAVIAASFRKMIEWMKPMVGRRDGDVLAQDSYAPAIRTAVAIAILTEWIRNGKDIAPDDLASHIITQIQATLDLNLLI